MISDMNTSTIDKNKTQPPLQPYFNKLKRDQKIIKKNICLSGYYQEQIWIPKIRYFILFIIILDKIYRAYNQLLCTMLIWILYIQFYIMVRLKLIITFLNQTGKLFDLQALSSKKTYESIKKTQQKSFYQTNQTMVKRFKKTNINTQLQEKSSRKMTLYDFIILINLNNLEQCFISYLNYLWYFFYGKKSGLLNIHIYLVSIQLQTSFNLIFIILSYFILSYNFICVCINQTDEQLKNLQLIIGSRFCLIEQKFNVLVNCRSSLIILIIFIDFNFTEQFLVFTNPPITIHQYQSKKLQYQEPQIYQQKVLKNEIK